MLHGTFPSSPPYLYSFVYSILVALLRFPTTVSFRQNNDMGELTKVARPLYVIFSTAATLLVYGIIVKKDNGMIAGGVIVALLGVFYIFLIGYRQQRQRTREIRKVQLQKEWETKYGNAKREKNMRTNMNYYPPYSKIPAITVKGLLKEPPLKPIKDKYGEWIFPDPKTTKDTKGKSKTKTPPPTNARLTTLEECIQAEAKLRMAILALRKYSTFEEEEEGTVGGGGYNVTNNTADHSMMMKTNGNDKRFHPVPLNEIVVQQVSPLADIPKKEGSSLSPLSTVTLSSHESNDDPSFVSPSGASSPTPLSSSFPSKVSKPLSSSPTPAASSGWFDWLFNTAPPPKTIPNCPTPMILRLLEDIVNCSVVYSNALLCCTANPLEWINLGGPERARVDLVLSIHKFYGIQRRYWNHECGLTLGDALFALSVACGYVQDELEKLRQIHKSSSSSSTAVSIGAGMIIGTGIAMALRSNGSPSEEMNQPPGTTPPPPTGNVNGSGEESEPPDIEEFLDSEMGETIFDKLGEYIEQIGECMACAGGSSE